MMLAQITRKTRKTQASVLMTLKPLIRRRFVNIKTVGSRKLYWTNIKEITIKLK